MMTQLPPGAAQQTLLPNVSSQILINSSASVNATASTTTTLPTTPYYRPGIPYHIFQNVVLPAFNNAPGGNLKPNELQMTIPTPPLSISSSTLHSSLVKTELPPVASVLKTDTNGGADFCAPSQAHITHTTNIKSEYGSQPLLAMASDGNNGNTTVISGGNINNLLLTAPAHLQPQLLDTTTQLQLQPQNHQPILLPLPLHVQQTHLPLQEQILDINSPQITTSSDGHAVMKKKKKSVVSAIMCIPCTASPLWLKLRSSGHFRGATQT